jgi:hypothetical protein
MARPSNYSKLPMHMRTGVQLYLEQGIEPGSFLRAVLENDLAGAARRADEVNRKFLFEWAEFLHNELPANSWGSPEIVDRWLETFQSDTFKANLEKEYRR